MEKEELEKIFELIAKDKLIEAFKALRKLLKGNSFLEEITLHSARYYDIKQKIRLGVIETKEADSTLNKIRYSLIQIINKLKDEEIQDVNDENTLNNEGSNLRVNDLKAQKDITINTKQQKKSSISINDLESNKGSININVEQK